MMDNNKAASSVAWPWKESSLDWVLQFSMSTCLVQLIESFRRCNLALAPDLELLTPVQAANVLAIHSATRWLGVAGAAAAVLAMLLEARARRIHRALACAALASAVAVQCVMACFVGVNLITAPNDKLLVGSVMSAVVFSFFAADAKAALILLSPHGAAGEEY